ncbi:MAG: DUF4959 domain-containing protein [Dysgonamonadaceae bacterium]|jgi:hypothetical protein|nr:DUF4959 domain-containing protein [Dysgonamonadaceae bacterium]
MKNIGYFLLACLLTFTISCKDNSTDGLDFDEVTDVQATSIPGGARLTWTPPVNALGVRIVYTIPNPEAPGLTETVEVMLPREVTSHEIDRFVDTAVRTVTIHAVYRPNFWSVGKQVSINPLLPLPPFVRGTAVVYRAEDILLTWETPRVPDDMTLTGFRVVYSLYGNNDITEVELAPDQNKIAIVIPDDVDEVTVTIYAVYIDNSDADRVSKGVVINIITLEPVPVENIEVENLPGGARIEWDAPDGRADYQGARVVFQYGEGGKHFEMFQRAGTNFIELEGYSNTKQHTVMIYAVFGRGACDGTPVTIQPQSLPWYGQKGFDMPGVARNLTIWEQMDWGNSHNDAAAHQIYQERTTMRGDLFVPAGRRTTRGFHHVYTWSSGTGADNMWQPGGDAANDQRMSHYIPDFTPDGFPPYPLYVTFDMSRRAFYERVAFLIRARGGGFAFPVVFNVWGTNEIKEPEEIGDGSRAANLAYWTSWTAANGTDAWKNDWTKIATCTWVFTQGAYAGLNRVVLPFSNSHLTGTDRQRFDGTLTPLRPNASFEPYPLPNTNRGLGFEFPLTTEGVNESFRYLRWEIEVLSADDLNGNTSRNMQIHALKFYGQYDE